ncbi:hypothetical protein K0B04_04025 [Patescibacteria group bacterium]|nr:hypothetical protein [Patescibacteria group bacterium]
MPRIVNSENTSETNTPESISQIRDIQESGVEFRGRGEIPKYVEKPLVKACEELYDKNIMTTWSSANYKNIDFNYPGCIYVDFKSLSDENREIAREMVEEKKAKFLNVHTFDGPARQLNLIIPISRESNVEEVEQYGLQLAERFKSQQLTWGYWDSVDHLKEYIKSWPYNEYLEVKDMDANELAEWCNQLGFTLYFDPVSMKFFKSEELRDKYLKTES